MTEAVLSGEPERWEGKNRFYFNEPFGLSEEPEVLADMQADTKVVLVTHKWEKIAVHRVCRAGTNLIWGGLVTALLLSTMPVFSQTQSTGLEDLAGNVGGDGYGHFFQATCAVCHGTHLEGTTQGKALLGELLGGDSVASLVSSIANGNPQVGMPAWKETLTDIEIKNLALYVSETRAGLNYADFNYDTPFEVPSDIYSSEKYDFRLRTIIADLDPLPFSIAPLPGGGMLLTEKKRGLSIVSAKGEKSEFIQGTPSAYDDTFILSVKQEWGYGWLLDVALHPQYEQNGWVYLYFGDRCTDCNTISRQSGGPVSMNKLVRGRIFEGTWIEEETIWATDIEHYGSVPDIGAGGRVAFDGTDHVFFTVGVKGVDNHTGIQDLSRPWGKIHRVLDNGDIPLDNPFMTTEGAIKSIWSYGHRSPQGLEYNFHTQQLWATEMGPRGGDEVNQILAGKNYGWPLYSKGLNYDGTTVAYGKKLGIEFDLRDIVQPMVDMTPSPAVSSFIFYTGSKFPEWQNNLLVGSLKGRTLYRMVLEDGQITQVETLIEGLSRFRDIEVGPNGEIYLLMEHNSGGQILELVEARETPDEVGTITALSDTLNN